MANVKIATLPAATAADSADEFPVVDTSASTTKRITLANLKTSLFAGGGTFTGNVDVEGRLYAEGTIGRLRLVETDQAADEQMIELLAAGGDLSLRTSDDLGGLQTEFLRGMRATGEARLTGASLVTVPAATGSGEAAQVSAYDAATGQLAIGGVEMGDTGWRDISTSMLGTFTADTFQVRRVGDLVEFRFENVTGGANTSLLNAFNAGFRPAGAIVTGLLSPGTTVTGVSPTVVRFNTSGNMFVDNTATNYGQVSFTTTATWPTTLPGSAA